MSLASDMAMSQFQQDPYPFYARWRADSPLFEAEPGNWLVTTYADAVGILRDSRFRPCRPTLGGADRQGPDLQQLRDIVHRWVMYQDPPDHARLRTLLLHAFAADFVSDLHSRLEALVGTILDECAERRSFDLIGDVAAPISVLLLADAMGLSRQDGALFRRWSAQVAPLLDGTIRPSHLDGAEQAVGETVEYLKPILRARRANPGDDVISRLAATRDHGVEPTPEELLATCVLLLTVGHETSATLLGNGMVALLQHPQELSRLRSDPSLGVRAVEEFLRFDSPVQVTSRVPLQDVPWAGATLAKGSIVHVFLGSANRDPAQFADPDRLDVGRAKNPHLGFAGGIHSCPGARMARLETRIAIEQMVRRFPNLALGPGEPVRRPGTVLRGYSSIPVQS
jgi:pimeloyl-[acyl-carrier protein] synthase